MDGFPPINDYANHILMCILRVDEQEHGNLLKLYGYDMKTDNDRARINSEYIVHVRDYWMDSLFPVNSIVRLISPLKLSEKVFEVNREHGLIIIEPDTLISCTTMAGMTFCPRKTVFSERFRGSGSSFAMLLGTIVHELFQKCLINKPRVLSRQYLFNEYRIYHLSTVCVELVALGETSLFRFESELSVYLESVCRWLKKYAPSNTLKSRQRNDDNYSNSNATKNKSPFMKNSSIGLSTVVDIEDNIWSPTLGVKGKIDVSFKSCGLPEIMPLELKTGKPHVVQHKTQVMLYSLMYSETMNAGRIAPGFVLYMKDNATRQIMPKAVELKGVLHMRNRVAPYFSHLHLDGFPKPIENSRLCSYCEHSTPCALVHQLNSDTNSKTSKKHSNLSIKDLSSSNTNMFGYADISQDMRDFLRAQSAHLQAPDVQYAKIWLKRIFAQWRHAKRTGKMKEIFFDAPVSRDTSGTCLAEMKLDTISSSKSGKFELKFVKHSGEKLKSVSFEVGDYVIISTTKQCAVYLHPITSMDEHSITITSEKMLIRSIAGSTENYKIDKYDSYTNFGLLLGNLALFMGSSEKITNLRLLIAGGRKPEFGSLSKESRQAFMAVKNQLVPSCLNQAVSIMDALKCKNYLLIDGKAETDRLLTALILVQCVLKFGKTVLITSSSSLILDTFAINLLKHLDENQLLRIGNFLRNSSFKKDEDILALQNLYLDAKLTKFDERKTDKFFNLTRDLLMKTEVIMSSCHRIATHSIFTIRTFDFCVVLDAHVLSEPMLIRPLMQVDRFVLFGDLSLPENKTCTNDASSGRDGSDDLDEEDKLETEKFQNLMQRLAEAHPFAVTRLGKLADD